MTCGQRSWLGALVAWWLCGCSPPPVQAPPADAGHPLAAPITHGVAAEVTATSAVVWARCDRETGLHVALRDRAGRETVASTAVQAADDFTGRLKFEGLEADSTYGYRAWCGPDSEGESDAASGALRTAPDARTARAVEFVWGGDLGGQHVCRDRAEGYPILRTITARRPDFFIGLGDMIYADDPCPATGRYGNWQTPGPPQPATDLPGFWAYWKYNREEDALRQLLAAVPYYAVWDDHEVLNDFGPRHDTVAAPAERSGVHLLPLGLKAFLDYNPIDAGTDRRLYRRVRWGRHLEVFFLDTRQYRDANFAPDDAMQPKTMLGAEQRRWLERSLRASEATWKVIVSSVPLSIPTGSADHGRDGWANGDQPTGFEHELLAILRFMAAHHINNSVWISTDIHFAAVFRDAPFPDQPAFRLYEIDTGPMNAGVFPKTDLDTTLNPERLFRYPESADPALGFAQAKSWFNFGVLRIDATGALTIEIVNTYGNRLFELALHPR